MRHIKSITAALLTATALTNTPVAQATPETDFLDGLTSHGIIVYDTNQTLANGWMLCDALDTANGAVVAEAWYRATSMDVPDRYTAGIWVMEAANHLCPWQLNYTSNTTPEPADVPIEGGMGGRIA
jgi:hypothetical protein